MGHRPSIGNPEECESPKEELERLARRCGKRYTSELARRIAKEMNLERARGICSSLDYFLQRLSILSTADAFLT